ncbi:MAG: pyridoxal phosphate-dependent aminotransferase [Spirochaetes bacterium]|nr:pyridoxal phosphate-dependent aminotransferase [Spirochaetota bacterium]MBU1081114.1 pyridoxal phosphate-dependent aminotransferase [Spirochaetota bacterium]
MRPALGAAALAPSVIRAMGAGAPPGCVSLGLGEPSWALPDAAARAIAESARPGERLPYGPNAGTPELRAALSAYLGTPEEGCMLAAGSQAALFALFQAWAGEGDEVLVPDPGFVAYPTLAAMAGATARPYSLADDGSLDPERFAAALGSSSRVRVAVVNHPANPTGAGAGAEELAAVAASCEGRGVLLVSDEVYRELYLGRRPAGVLDGGTRSGVVALGSMSKAFAAPGLRVGWAYGDPEALAPARLVHNAMTSCLARPSQAAALALLGAAAETVEESRRQLALRWAAFESAMRLAFPDEPPPAPPAGGFYHWLRLAGRAGEDTLASCLRLRDERGVIVVPGSAFGSRGEGYARLSWAGHPGDVAEGVKRLAAYD